jgi:hypothetical protein
MRFIDGALAGYRRVLLVPGNHDHYEGVIEDTATTLRHFLPGVSVLDDEAMDVDGVGVFGTTLWTDFDGGEAATLAAVRRRMGEYFFVKTRSTDGSLRKFEPGDALVRHRKALTALKTALDAAPAKPWIVVSHHSPSRLGANTAFADNGLDAAYFSRLDSEIEALPMVSAWAHARRADLPCGRSAGGIERAGFRRSRTTYARLLGLCGVPAGQRPGVACERGIAAAGA